MAVPQKSSKGFTLVELLIVIAIIGVLSTIGIVVFGEIQKKARDAKRLADIDVIAKTFELKYNSVGTYGDLDPSLPENQQLFSSEQIPKDPLGSDYTIIQNSQTKGFRICASLKDNPPCSQPSETCSCRSSQQADQPSLTLSSDENEAATSILTNTDSVIPACPANSLTAYWDFNEGSGNTVGANGSWNGTGSHWSTTSADSSLGNTGIFNGSNDYVSFPINPQLNFTTQPFTISSWINFEGGGAAPMVISAYNQWEISCSGNSCSVLLGKAAGGFDSFGVTATSGSWHHIAVVRDPQGSGRLSFYVDGTIANSISSTAPLANQGGNIKIGARPSGSGVNAATYFRGMIDEVRIYSRALDANSISTLYNGCI